MFKNVIVYGYENDKLWFGRVTLRSWLRAFFRDGGLLAVKPIKGYEQYAYYSDVLLTELDYCNITNFRNRCNPIWAIKWAERHKGGIKTTDPIHGGKNNEN